MDLRTDLAKIIHGFVARDGLHATPLAGVHCLKFSQPTGRVKRHWSASLIVVVQGCKEIILGREVHRCDAAHTIATPIDLPVTSRVLAATPEKPFLALKIDLDPLILSELAAQVKKDLPEETARPLPALFIGKAGDRMLESAIRLARLFRTPEDAGVLGPLAIKETLYHLLRGPDGPAIRQFGRAGSRRHQIFQAVHRLKSELENDADIAVLAQAAHMSRSAFFKHFKEMTALSPIQYRKRLRLLEARRLMIDGDETAERAAFQVGYTSASQFSREYGRMFGTPPSRDAMKTKKAGRPVYQV